VNHNTMIKRLMVIFGTPESHDPEAYLAEIERVLSPYSQTTLHDAADHLLETYRSRVWPTPAQCVKACQDVVEEAASKAPSSHNYRFPSKRGPYSRETLESWRKATEWRASLPDNHPLVRQGADFAKKLPDVSRPAFEKMQRESPNGMHRKAAPLTNISRRMSGETE
jgi:hypothetical protein